MSSISQINKNAFTDPVILGLEIETEDCISSALVEAERSCQAPSGRFFRLLIMHDWFSDLKRNVQNSPVQQIKEKVMKQVQNTNTISEEKIKEVIFSTLSSMIKNEQDGDESVGGWF